MLKYLDIMADVLRLLTFQTKPERRWEEPRRRQDRSTERDVRPGG